LRLLAQTRVLELHIVQATCDFRDAQTRRPHGLRGLLPSGFGAGHGRYGLVSNQLLRLDIALQMFDLLLARQQPGLVGIGSIEANAVRLAHMPLGHDQRPTGTIALAWTSPAPGHRIRTHPPATHSATCAGPGP